MGVCTRKWNPYGVFAGSDVFLTLTIAESHFYGATILRAQPALDAPATQRLRPSRSYTLSLSPQCIFAQSRVLPALVSSQVNTQLEFLAFGPWWILKHGTLHRIPSSREDVFADDSLSMRDKRGLMKFLRFVMQDAGNEDSETVSSPNESLASILTSRFHVPPSLHSPIVALSVSTVPASEAKFEDSLSSIQQHLRSIGRFGAGFGAVIAKHGSNSEIVQVACRAGAVGGGVYVLGHGIRSIAAEKGPDMLEVELSEGVKIRTRAVVGSTSDLLEYLPRRAGSSPTAWQEFAHCISLVDSTLNHLFPPTSENGPVPAGTIVFVEDDDNGVEATISRSPLYLRVHSDETGECPRGQCTSVISPSFSIFIFRPYRIFP